MDLTKAIHPAAGRKKAKRKIVLAAGMMIGGINCGGAAKPAPVKGPSIVAVDPAYGAPGTRLTVEGSHLAEGTLVASFAGAETIPVERSAEQVVLVVPAGAATGDLVLRNEGGSSNPVHVKIAAADTQPWASVAAGSFHTCGIKADGSGWCWGENRAGQLGYAGVDDAYYPRKVSAEPLRQITLGSYLEFGNTCGLLKTGSLWCWGDNESAQFGNGNSVSSRFPAPGAVTDAPWSNVSLGSFHTCGLAGDQLYCWGTQRFQVLTDGDPVYYPALVTPPAGESGWSAVSAGTLHTCAITSPGAALYCWGDNHGGQLGDGTTIDRAAPAAVMPGVRWRTVSSGSYLRDGNSCGIQEDGSLWCWGDNGYGQVGAGNDDSLVPLHVSPAVAWRSVSVGGLHVCAIDETDALWCWGGNQEGQLGADTGKADRRAPEKVKSDMAWQEVAAGAAHTCALTKTGALYCWGANNGGQLGFYGEDAVSAPRKVDRVFKDW